MLNPNLTPTSYLKLTSDFYKLVNPMPIFEPSLVLFNLELATLLNFQPDFSENETEIVNFCAGNWLPSNLKSIALAYAGHQFGYYVPILGDGRALMLGEIGDKNRKRWDIQLKGSGKTPFSRMGDGRAPLAAVLREYLVSEGMQGLKIPTTRCLAVIASKEEIYRQQGAVPLGVLTRIAGCSLRVGSFEYAANQNNTHLLKELADYTLERIFPELLHNEAPYLDLFAAVMDKQASLIADWMGVGFIHGVMNTDNMTISGETIDYGPCAFMDEFDSNRVFSSIDINGRYAFANQASIAHWNLARFRDALKLLFTDEKSFLRLEEIYNTFPARFHYYWHKKISRKLGLFVENEEQQSLINQFFKLLQQHKPDFTNTFRLLANATTSNSAQKTLLLSLGNQAESQEWIAKWLVQISQQNITTKELKARLNQINPAYIPRNHLVEQSINSFIEKNDRTLIDELLLVLKDPYQRKKNTEHLQRPPLSTERVQQTFCGT